MMIFLDSRLIDHYVKRVESQGLEGSGNNSSSSSTTKDAVSKKGYSWFPWRRSQTSDSHEHSTSEHPNSSPESRSSVKQNGSPAKSTGSNGSVKQQVLSVTSSSDESEGGGGRDDKTAERLGRTGSLPTPIPGTVILNPEKYKKTLRLSSEQIVSAI